MKLSTLSVDHLGLVAGIFDELGISEVIDKAMPKTRECKLNFHARLGTHEHENGAISIYSG